MHFAVVSAVWRKLCWPAMKLSIIWQEPGWVPAMLSSQQRCVWCATRAAEVAQEPHGHTLLSTTSPMSPAHTPLFSPVPGYCAGSAVSAHLLLEESWLALGHLWRGLQPPGLAGSPGIYRVQGTVPTEGSGRWARSPRGSRAGAHPLCEPTQGSWLHVQAAPHNYITPPSTPIHVLLGLIGVVGFFVFMLFVFVFFF